MFVRRIDGAIVGAAEEPQDGWDNEQVEDNNPELQAYLNPAPAYNWQGLKADLRGTDLFGKIMQTNYSNAVALLLDVFQSSDSDSDRWNDFKYALILARMGLEVDYTEEQLQRFRDILTANGFDSEWVT